MLMHVYGTWKDHTDESICRAAMGDGDLENRLLWTHQGGGQEGEGEINGENSTDTYTLANINSQWEFAV